MCPSTCSMCYIELYVLHGYIRPYLGLRLMLGLPKASLEFQEQPCGLSVPHHNGLRLAGSLELLFSVFLSWNVTLTLERVHKGSMLRFANLF